MANQTFLRHFIKISLFHFSQNLIDNLIKTAKFPDRIKIIVSYHDNESLANLKESVSFNKISTLIKVGDFKSNCYDINTLNDFST